MRACVACWFPVFQNRREFHIDYRLLGGEEMKTHFAICCCSNMWGTTYSNSKDAPRRFNVVLLSLVLQVVVGREIEGSDVTSPSSSREYHGVSKTTPASPDSGSGGGGSSSSSSSRGAVEEEQKEAVAVAGDRGGAYCPRGCTCQGDQYRPQVDCSGRNLTNLPDGLSHLTTHLDLSVNKIEWLPRYAFSGFTFLEEIRLDRNRLSTLPEHVFTGIVALTKLNLQGNFFKEVPVEAFGDLNSLHELHLDDNEISYVPSTALLPMRKLKQLWLGSNRLKAVPSDAINHVTSLEALTLAGNAIKAVQEHAFQNLTALFVLLLYDNEIEHIDDHAFDGLGQLNLLELDKNRLTRIPVSLSSLPQLEELSLSDNKIKYLPDNSFASNKRLKQVVLKGNPIMSIGRQAFAQLPHLTSLVLSEARDQEFFPDLTGTVSLQLVAVDRGSIKSIPDDLCGGLQKLMTFDAHSNRLSVVPNLTRCVQLRNVNIGNNDVRRLDGCPFKGLALLKDLTLSRNHIQVIPADAFAGLVSLQYLDLQHNRIEQIHADAFLPLVNLADLNLGENVFSVLPTDGLQKIKNLKTFGNKYLTDFPSAESFPSIQLLTLSYAYHCCDFIPKPVDSENQMKMEEDIVFLQPENYDMRLWDNLTDVWMPLANRSSNYQELADNIYETFGTDFDFEFPEDLPASATHLFSDLKPRDDAEDIVIKKPPIECKPMPGPFMPCDDLMGWWSLRCGVWVVFLLALLGNGAVLLVNFISRTKMDVPRFLICNLAGADFFMGIYLGILAMVDASTLGEFKKTAIKWQMSPGCQIAGFFVVLSSELSVYTLTTITLERVYAITHAVHLNKRLSLKNAGYVMTCGWFVAGFLASLPLCGISDYRKFAICLPFETGDKYSLGYVCFLLLINCSAFIVIMACYTKMYFTIRGSQAWNSNDSRVAKRMALLVFTDFACWAPIAFFSLTAAFGLDILSLNDAKVFAIFILPLNSCANPFLYAILTKQFKKDCRFICRRLEESALSRSLSRLSNRNLSWGSSRRPSALNSFMQHTKHSTSGADDNANLAIAAPISEDRPKCASTQKTPNGGSSSWRLGRPSKQWGCWGKRRRRETGARRLNDDRQRFAFIRKNLEAHDHSASPPVAAAAAPPPPSWSARYAEKRRKPRAAEDGTAPSFPLVELECSPADVHHNLLQKATWRKRAPGAQAIDSIKGSSTAVRQPAVCSHDHALPGKGKPYFSTRVATCWSSTPGSSLEYPLIHSSHSEDDPEDEFHSCTLDDSVNSSWRPVPESSIYAKPSPLAQLPGKTKSLDIHSASSADASCHCKNCLQKAAMKQKVSGEEFLDCQHSRLVSSTPDVIQDTLHSPGRSEDHVALGGSMDTHHHNVSTFCQTKGDGAVSEKDDDYYLPKTGLDHPQLVKAHVNSEPNNYRQVSSSSTAPVIRGNSDRVIGLPADSSKNDFCLGADPPRQNIPCGEPAKGKREKASLKTHCICATCRHKTHIIARSDCSRDKKEAGGSTQSKTEPEVNGRRESGQQCNKSDSLPRRRVAGGQRSPPKFATGIATQDVEICRSSPEIPLVFIQPPTLPPFSLEAHSG